MMTGEIKNKREAKRETKYELIYFKKITRKSLKWRFQNLLANVANPVRE